MVCSTPQVVSEEDEQINDDLAYITDVDRYWIMKGLDMTVNFSGHGYFLALLIVIMLVWIVIGIIYHAPQDWQVVMQDGQSIQCYLWDTILMRHQLTEHTTYLKFCATSKSRILTLQRLIGKCNSILEKVVFEDCSKSVKGIQNLDKKETKRSRKEIWEEKSDIESKIAPENSFQKFSTRVSDCLGSLVLVGIYWAGIFVWLGFGAVNLLSGNTPPFTGKYSGTNPEYTKWGNNWQLYINTATAVVLLVASVFLQNMRYRHEKHVQAIMEIIVVAERHLELLLRNRTNDYLPNPTVQIEREKRNPLEKVIDFYADLVGTGVGVVLAVCVFAVWLAVGNLMKWNSTWWLIIGTYTGLVGFLDGFVMRLVYLRISSHEEVAFQEVFQEAGKIVGVKPPSAVPDRHSNVSFYGYRCSVWIKELCSSSYTVVLAVLTIVGLVIAASVMHWTTTGQLIANTPTMIIEGFMLIILIQAHNWDDYRRRQYLDTLYAGVCNLTTEWEQ